MKNLQKTLLLLLSLSVTFVESIGQVPINSIKCRITGYALEKNSTFICKTFKSDQIREDNAPVATYTVPLDSIGGFVLEFTPPERYFYITFTLISGDKRVSEMTKSFWNVYFLSEANDDIVLDLDIKEKRIEFKGKGADKLQCQALLASVVMPREMQHRLFELHTTDYEQKLRLQAEQVKLLLAQQSLILQSFSGQIGEELYKRIYADVVSQTKFNYIYGDLLGPYRIGITKNRSTIIEHFRRQHNSSETLVSNEESLKTSAGYIGFLLKRDALIYEMFCSEGRTHKRYFEWMMEHIPLKYSGILRDKAIIAFLISSIRQFPREVIAELPLALKMIQDTSQKSFLQDWHDKQTLGSKAHSFSFQDLSGKYHKLKDYRDKIVIMDFWFTGCRGCTQIPPVLKLIQKRFAKRKDIVFLSVSIDISKKLWLSGLKSGNYTTPGQVHLYTNGLGRNDPFVINYNINVFPRLIVIGKDNRLVSANPPDPRRDNGTEIINMIELAIQQKSK